MKATELPSQSECVTEDFETELARQNPDQPSRKEHFLAGSLFALFYRYSRRQGVWCGCQQIPLVDEAWTGTMKVNLVVNIFE